ncbi:hypothetical protein LPB67_10895 [Undibacterium sp. Jales W-56]|uniref:hypothetical protein n=1 Tax=Undibacterium sp. Jales W-56 TaxID=2897325 RepID=UPI0021D0B671|nr:hypothetical protein [Undibacterium sp. Jales W-56]MCU6434277.1 hypothetical protein [Undibacterium sp. Jales W-56]
MKTTFTTSAILGSALVAGIFAVGAAFQPVAVSAPVSAAQVQTVTIIATRMSAAQKLAFDAEASGVQTVVISAKRLTEEQKIAMAQEDRVLQLGIAAKAIRTSQKNG